MILRGLSNLEIVFALSMGRSALIVHFETSIGLERRSVKFHGE